MLLLETNNTFMTGLPEMLIILGIILLIIYILISLFLNNFNKLKYGQGTILAYIPILNIYLLGKLTFNKPAGVILLIMYTTQNYLYKLTKLDILFNLYSLVTIIVIICTIIKYYNLKKR